MLYNIIILLSFAVSAGFAQGEKYVPYDKIISGENFESYLQVYTGKADNPDDIDTASEASFKPYSWDDVADGKSNMWIRFGIDNQDNYELNYVLGNNQFQFLEFYQKDENGIYHVNLSGTLCAHNQMEIVEGAASWFNVKIPAKSKMIFYIRASNNEKVKYQYSKQPFTLYTLDDFNSFRGTQSFFGYFFWGALIIITFYNFMLYFQLRGRIYLFYVFNNIVILLFVLSQSGMITEKFFHDSQYYEHLLLILGNIAFIFYVLFCKEFLELKRVRPKLNKILNWILLFWPTPLVLIFFNQSEIAVTIGGLIALWAYTMIMITAYRSIKMGERAAKYFFIANLFYYVGIIISILQIAQILPRVFLGMYPVNFVQIGTLLQVSLFSLTVGFRILKMQREIIEKQVEQERIKTEEEQKRRILIEQQNQVLEAKVAERTIELEKSNKSLKEQSIVLEVQKALVEEKQKEIIDSINYARRIQYTLLAHDVLLQQNLKDYFVLFQPKDIVSGDFFWAILKDDKFYIAVCDSTGHGVPGAFMSLLNITFLNEAIMEKNIHEPGKILDYVRQKLIVTQDGAKDGMDGTLVCITKGSDTIQYASAYNKPLLVRNGISTSLFADKMPVGRSEKQDHFNEYSLEIKKGDIVYFFTDGFADQFGGPLNKKFKLKALVELLQNNSQKPLKEQKRQLYREFIKWRGNEEQVDDLCVFGLRFD